MGQNGPLNMAILRASFFRSYFTLLLNCFSSVQFNVLFYLELSNTTLGGYFGFFFFEAAAILGLMVPHGRTA